MCCRKLFIDDHPKLTCNYAYYIYIYSPQLHVNHGFKMYDAYCCISQN